MATDSEDTGAPAAIPDADELRAEIVATWLRLGRFLRDWGSEYDWIDDVKAADTAIGFAQRSEHCLLRAACVARGQFIPERALEDSEGQF